MNNEYNKQAKDFLKRNNTKLSIKFNRFDSMNWDTDGQKRNIFDIELSNVNGQYNFEFGDSVQNSCKADNPKLRKPEIEQPTEYDVLSCLSVGYYENADEVYEEFGEMKPSQAQAIFEEDKAIQGLFTEVQLEELSEIS